MTPRAHFQTIWRRKWLILIASLIVGLVVYLVSDSQAKTYQAQAQLNVTAGQPPGQPPVGQDVTLFLANTYASLGTTRPVVADAVGRSHLGISVNTALDRLSVSASSQVGTVNVSATGPNPNEATALARGESQALVAAVTVQQAATLNASLAPVQQQIAQVGGQLATLEPGTPAAAALSDEYQSLVQSATSSQLAPKNRLDEVSPAIANPAPISPNPKRDALLGFLTALVVNSELAVGIELLSDRFSSDDLDEDIGRVTGLPVLARVPASGHTDTVEAFRSLRTNLLFMDTGEKVRTVAVVSPEPGTGKSFSSINLAACMEELGVPAALIDADMRRPVIDERLNLPRSPGLSDVLQGLDPNQAVHRIGKDRNLLVLTAGRPVSDPVGLLGRQLRGRVLPGLHEAQLVVVDTPAEGPFADAVAIALQCDATIVVLDRKMSRRRTARAMLQRLRQVNAKPLGVVVNRANVPGRQYGYYTRYSRRDNGMERADLAAGAIERVRGDA